MCFQTSKWNQECEQYNGEKCCLLGYDNGVWLFQQYNRDVRTVQKIVEEINHVGQGVIYSHEEHMFIQWEK
jgi:hypothetical protein